jgi:DNA-binding transcriptional ArsR family regulator
MGTKRRCDWKSMPSASRVDVERDEGRAPSVVDALFTSTQRHVLACLFGEPGRAMHLRELLAVTGAGHGAVQREVGKLVRAGLVRVERRGNRKYLQADPRSPIHAELAALVRKTIGLAEPLRHHFQGAARHFDACFAFEPERDPHYPARRELGLLFARARPSPFGMHDYGRDGAEQHLGRSIFMLTADAQRLRADPYLGEVMRRPRVWIFGDESALAALAGADLP